MAQNYSYARYGNKLTTASSGITADTQAIPTDGLPSLSYTTSTNRISTTGYDYDKAGNLIRGQSPNGTWQRFEYDAAGRLVKIKDDSNNVLETYTYGASRERLIKESNGQRTYYAWGGSSVLVEYFETATTPGWTKSYIYAGTRLLSTISNVGGNEATEYQHPNRLGTQLITNAVSQYEQATLPFGTSLEAETTGTSNQRFTSYDRSTSTGLDYAVNRTYNSGQSRFTQVDPIGMSSTSIGNPQSMNLYAYVGNEPTNYVDPSGLFRGRERAESPDYSALLSLLLGLFDRDLAQPVVDGGEVGGSGDDTGGSGGGNQVRNESVEDAVKRCGEKLGLDISQFVRSQKGTNGSAVVEGNTSNGISASAKITNDVNTFNSDEIGQFSTNSSDTIGLTFPKYFEIDVMIQVGSTKGTRVKGYVSPSKNYTANNLANKNAILATQIHELGNSIYFIFGKQLPLATSRRDKVHGGDKDAGAAFEDCVYGGRIVANGTLQTR